MRRAFDEAGIGSWDRKPVPARLAFAGRESSGRLQRSEGLTAGGQLVMSFLWKRQIARLVKTAA